MRTYPFHFQPQIAVLLGAYRRRLKHKDTGPEGTESEYEARLATLSYDELLDCLLEACPKTYAATAFDGMPTDELIQRLMGLASGHLRAETHWPLLGNFLSFLRHRSRHDVHVVDFAVVGEAIITAYNQRLTEVQKENVVEHVTSQIDFRSIAMGERQDQWSNVQRFSPIGECYSPWMLDVLGSTVGKVSKSVYTHDFREACRINQMLGSKPMQCVLLTLDFREDPWKYWDSTSNNVVDQLGVCIYAGPDSPHIVLFMRGIAKAADDLGHPEKAHRLGMLVFLHEFAHAIHLGLEDLDGIRNPASPEPCIRQDWVELVAQLSTWTTIKDDPKLAPLFEAWTDISPPEYQRWRTMRNCSMEDFRAYLWFLRRNCAVKNRLDFQTWFCADYPDLPPIPKPQDDTHNAP